MIKNEKNTKIGRNNFKSAQNDDEAKLTVVDLNVMEQILGEGGFGQKDWNKLIKSGKITKVYNKKTGSIQSF